MVRRPSFPRPQFSSTAARCAFVRETALRAFDFLIAAGFAPAPGQDECSPLLAEVHFVGVRRAFVLSYDVRDDAVGLYMREVTDGVARNERPPTVGWHVHDYLVRYHGYRGGGARREPAASRLRAIVAEGDTLFPSASRSRPRRSRRSSISALSSAVA